MISKINTCINKVAVYPASMRIRLLVKSLSKSIALTEFTLCHKKSNEKNITATRKNRLKTAMEKSLGVALPVIARRA